MPSQALIIDVTSVVENGSTSFGLMLRGDLIAFGDVLRTPFAVTAETAELPQQFQFLAACDGLQGTTGAERVQVTCAVLKLVASGLLSGLEGLSSPLCGMPDHRPSGLLE